jgi:CBS domain-containing protein
MLVDAIMNTNVVTVTRDHTVLAAARLMREESVGSVVVLDDHSRPIGMLTDRDITVKLVAEGGSADAPVDEIMSTPVYAVPENTLIFDLLREMSRRKVHRVPVIDRENRMIGICSVDDALLLLTTELVNVADVMGHRTRVLDQ